MHTTHCAGHRVQIAVRCGVRLRLHVDQARPVRHPPSIDEGESVGVQWIVEVSHQEHVDRRVVGREQSQQRADVPRVVAGARDAHTAQLGRGERRAEPLQVPLDGPVVVHDHLPVRAVLGVVPAHRAQRRPQSEQALVEGVMHLAPPTRRAPEETVADDVATARWRGGVVARGALGLPVPQAPVARTVAPTRRWEQQRRARRLAATPLRDGMDRARRAVVRASALAPAVARAAVGRPARHPLSSSRSRHPTRHGADTEAPYPPERPEGFPLAVPGQRDGGPQKKK